MGYLPFHANPKKPVYKVPDQACDSHCHVFGPAARFPYSLQRKYTPVDAPKESLFALHQHLGFERGVLVQASCHGTDNSAMLEMLQTYKGQYRGVAVVDDTLSIDEIRSMHDAGVRGVRFNFVKRLVQIKPLDFYRKIAEMVAAFGWHVIVYFEARDLVWLEDLLLSLPVPFVIDHMGRPDVELGVGNVAFQRVRRMVSSNKETRIKVGCLERLSKVGPPYPDIVEFARDLVESFPDQVLWGTDWPHPNMTSHMPDDGQLVDMIPQIAVSEELRYKLLVTNPQRLYDFDE